MWSVIGTIMNHMCSETTNVMECSYRQISISKLLALVCLPLLEMGPVLASGGSFPAELFPVVRERAIEAQSPAALTESARVLSAAKWDAKVTVVRWEWMDLEGIQIGYVRSDDLGKVKTLAKHNESILRTAMRNIHPPARKVQLHSVGSRGGRSSGLLADICGVSVKWQMRNEDVQIVMSSGQAIAIPNACRMLAWAFAANGIRFERAGTDAHALLLSEEREINGVKEINGVRLD